MYVGVTQGLLKQRYYNNKSSLAYEIYRYKTSLSNYVWEIKRKFGINPILKWETVKSFSKYKGEGECMGENYLLVNFCIGERSF